MPTPGPGCSTTVRVSAPASASTTAELTAAVDRAGGALTALTNAIIRLLHAQGARRIVGVDRQGAVHAGMELDREADPGRAWIAEHTDPDGRTGSLEEVLAGADVLVGVAAPDVLTGDDVATGRSDHPDQIDDVLVAVPRGGRGAGAAEVSS